MKLVFCAVLFFASVSERLFSDDGYEPLYAGTLLAFYSENAAPGHLSFQPYIFAGRNYGDYDQNWKVDHLDSYNSEVLYLSLETGITKFLDISLDIFGSYSQSKGGNTWLFGDMQIYLGLQLLTNKKGTWVPDLRILVGENFPTGKYDNLNPNKLGSDVSGTGAFSTIFVLVARKIFYLFPKHPFNFNLNLYCVLSNQIDVHGFNFYQEVSANGRIKPGAQYVANLGFEYSFTKKFAGGIDVHYIHQDKSPFHGKEAATGSPSFEQLSLAPCLEYNFSENFSIAAGAWFTVLGRNAAAFASGVANVYYYF